MLKFLRSFRIIFAREFRETLRTRFFRFTSLLFGITLILAAAAAIMLQLVPADSPILDGGVDYSVLTDDVPFLQPDDITSRVVMVDNRAGDDYILQRLAQLTPSVAYFPAELDAESIPGWFCDGSANGCLIITSPEDIVLYPNPYEYSHELTTALQTACAQLAKEHALAQLGLSADDIAGAMDTPSPLVISEVSRTDLLNSPDEDDSSFSFSSTGASISVFIISTLLFSSISFYGQLVSGRVSAEKSTRMIEVLANSATPAELLCGKVMGVGTAGFAQVTLFYTLLLLLASAGIERLAELFPYIGEVTAEIVASAGSNVGYVFLYLLLGFFQLAFTYGCIGAISTDTEGVSGFAALPLCLPSVGYFTAMMAPYISGSPLLTAASYMPLLAPFAMPARLGVEPVPTWEIILSVMIQLAGAALIAIIAARLYRRYMLRYGQPPKLRELMEALRSSSR